MFFLEKLILNALKAPLTAEVVALKVNRDKNLATLEALLAGGQVTASEAIEQFISNLVSHDPKVAAVYHVFIEPEVKSFLAGLPSTWDISKIYDEVVGWLTNEEKYL